MKYRKMLPDGTKVRMLRNVGYAKRGQVYSARTDSGRDGDNCALVNDADKVVIWLYGPGCIRQYREGHTWELVKDDQS